VSHADTEPAERAATSSVAMEIDGDVAVIRVDDGKANALGPGTITALGEAIDRAEAECGAMVLAGRDGRFSAGFDLSVMTAGVDQMRSLVTSGAELLLRLYGSPIPTVAACTGHALAMGSLLLLACDTRIGADGPFKVGLNEVAIGMGLPVFAVELARDRLTPRHFTEATIQARIYDPAGAVEAGYLDQVVPADELLATARDQAAALAQLRRGAVAHTKVRARQATIQRIASTLAEDMATAGMPEAS
jgi:enoyl-CoA hydratase/carnithine racemase